MELTQHQFSTSFPPVLTHVNGRLVTFARIRKLIDATTSLLIYKQTILPILDYMCIIVNSSSQCKIRKLQPLQNRALVLWKSAPDI